MANYAAPLLQGTVSTTFKSAGVLYSNATRRAMVYEIEFGQTGALASTDCQCQWDVSRFSQTAILTGTVVAANPLDTADSIAVTLYQNAISSELTYTTAGVGLNLKQWGINQRGSYRWRALDDGDNIIIPATTLTGVGVRVLSSNFAATALGTISFLER
jgi:hypothetical protein